MTSTSTSTSTVTTLSSTTSVSVIPITVTTYSTTITSYAACATNNLGEYVNGNAIVNGNDGGGAQESSPGGTADNDPYDCCVAAILDPIGAAWRFVLPAATGSCYIIEQAGTNGTCPNGQAGITGNNVDTQSGATPAFAAGNANCGQFEYLNGAFN